MQTLQWTTRDKSSWPRGPWDSEPDKRQWQDEATGYPCLIVRNPGGALCGYVGVSPNHPLHGEGYDTPDIHVHGGLTFASECQPTDVEAWEAWRKQIPQMRNDAEGFPLGDSAEHLREWCAYLDDYDSWLAHRQKNAICHIPAPGEPDDVWWFGFDCAHFGDLCPKFPKFELPLSRYSLGETYKTIDYVTRECEKLARELKSLEGA